MALVLSSHDDGQGCLYRLRHELRVGATASTRWLYTETRCVVLLDARRSALIWSRQPHDALGGVLDALARGHTSAPAALTVHVSVVLGAREGWPLRVLVQGYQLVCGQPAEPLRALHPLGGEIQFARLCRTNFDG